MSADRTFVILNMSSLEITKELSERGVVDASPSLRKEILDLLEPKELTTYGQAEGRAKLLAALLEDCTEDLLQKMPTLSRGALLNVLINDPTFLLPPLQAELLAKGVTVVYPVFGPKFGTFLRFFKVEAP